MVDPLFAPSADEVVRIALPVPIDELFDYALPAEDAERAVPGCRVRVRFRKRHLTGVIVERTARPTFDGRLLQIEALVDSEPVLSASMLDILREEAAEVLCPIGIALAAALPSGSTPRVARGFAITARGREALRSTVLPDSARPILEALAERPLTAARLGKRVAVALPSKRLQAALADLAADRLIAPQAIERSPATREATQRVAALAEGVDVDALTHGVLARAPQQTALLARLAGAGTVPVRVLERDFPRAGALLRRLADRGLVEIGDRLTPRDVLGTPLESAGPVDLTPEQADALKPIADAIAAGRAETFLLHGVTGSGKTEVYLRAVEEALRRGRQALVLVPEITLTHQILARIRGRFGDDLALLHSGLRPGERLEQWQRLRRGGTPIAVGARSALFAPLDNLGIIVIDEEHDGAYKNDEGFRYHARDLAARRAARAGCPLVLGSATPALETRYAADRGELRRLVLSSRIGRRPLPAVEIVDLQRERNLAPRGRKVILSRALSRAMDDTLQQGGQTILLLNRRGFATQVLCFSCGFAERCRHCDIALVYHASEQRLRCHYCDYRIEPPEACSQCGAADTALLGIGTQRLEEEVRARFPGARSARLDRDVARERGYTERVLRDVRAGRLDIVIGTQMVAKGHDFPGVRLVGVVLADIGLHIPDFRAAERTFQLLTQVAGRAGRDAAPGRVIVQTLTPQHYAIRPVVTHDYESFYTEEIGYRASLGYPPFGRLVHARVSATDEAAARAGAESLARSVATESDLEILGPAPAPLARLRGRYRFQLLVKGPSATPVRRAAEALLAAAARLPRAVQASVDPRPTNML